MTEQDFLERYVLARASVVNESLNGEASALDAIKAWKTIICYVNDLLIIKENRK
jgi:hypothetical protein